ncbi:hypothetical protein [Aeoliella sp.]|uniref:hypothetical protein n=1 Tax=Aeoliella sp. TaxID=2795800 RepID=UPI003CCB87D1
MMTTRSAATCNVQNQLLRTYLLDHLTGGDTALQVLRDFEQQEARRTNSELAQRLLPEIEHDREVLRRLLQEVGGTTNAFRRFISWLSGKMSGLKFWWRLSKELGPFEGLEVLSLGILGKRALWRTLQRLQSDAGVFPNQDFDSLIQRAESQYTLVENGRMQAVPHTFLCRPS